MSPDVLKYLRNYNEWRRGSDKFPSPDPKELGEKIDAACDELERLRKNKMVEHEGSEHVISLLPCPLCGGQAKFIEDEDEDGPIWFVECNDCMLMLGQFYGFTSKLDLCNAWNKRIKS